MKAKTKVILGSAMTAAMCASLIAGSTFALFTSEAKTNISVTAGKVNVTATLGNAKLYTKFGTEAETEGWLGGSSVTKEGLVEGENLKLANMTPGAGVRVPLNVTNGSNVSIKYQLSFTYTNGTESTSDLFDVLQIKADDYELNKGDHTLSGEWYSAEPEADLFTDGELMLDIYLPDTADDTYQESSGNLFVQIKAVQGNAAVCGGVGSATGHLYDASHHCFYCGQTDPLAAFYGADGTAYFKETASSVTITGVPEETTELTIPATANGKKVNIAEHAFTETNLEKVVFGEGFSCSDLPQNIFKGSDTLKSVEFSSTMTDFGVLSDSKYFEGCTSLDTVVFKGDVTQIAPRMFYGCTSLQTIDLPESLETINKEAFNGSGLTEIVIPASVSKIDSYTFRSCENLVCVTFGEGSQLTAIENGTFLGCSALKKITLPESLTTIKGNSSFTPSSGAFAQSGLTKIHIPATVETIEGCTFANCAELAEVTFAEGSKLTTIGNYAFYSGGNAKIKNQIAHIELPDSVTSIGGSAFGSCEALEWIVIGHKSEAETKLTINNSALPNKVTVYFKGDTTAWETQVEGGGKPTAVKYFSETGADLDEPANYWRYEGGVPKLWSEE